MKVKLIATMIVITVTALSGCWSMNESERMLYVHGIGIDYKDDKFEVHAQVINFIKVAKSEEPKGEVEQVSVGHATGQTIDEAIFNLYKTMDERVYWGHLMYTVVSEELLQAKKLPNVIDLLTRFIDTRYNMYVYCTNEPLEDVLLTVPIIKTAITLSRLANPSNLYEQSSYIEPIDMRKLIIGLNEPNHEIGIPYVTVVENWKSVKDKTGTIKMSGVGIVTPNDFKGFIKGDKANGLRWMNNKTKEVGISFLLNEADEDSRTAVVLSKVHVNVKPIVKDNAVQFDIKISGDGVISSLTRNVKSDVLRKRISEEVEREIKETYKEALEKDIDIYRLSEHVYRENHKTWKKLEENGKIDLNEDSIRSLHVKVRKIKAGRKSLSETID